ncbi:hypothetical protein BU25DRAFT_441214 [Macroventuria anomochaeta]|uniref:Uncharacterized protein n=1 Tax=Macroventuria anomochaeta TaxID=301207 RepID=A0ACB6RX76_9PLEO|nr:uncharacterized protein BU25DRAFT_441214 [Macroventuria anomochaeta]KAF2625748.1 hypothetical protein BU25DRAFT_441214 [Macroventuria anomochaeta]
MYLARQLECFDHERNLPLYAILSHTRASSEVTMQQYREAVSSNDDRSDHVKTTQTYLKIEASCLQACADNLPYIWIDTSCIDKTSSAELSEAINSMFHHTAGAAPTIDDATLGKAGWFTSGWTLQELIAPRHMNFYDRNWICFETKGTLNYLIGANLRKASVAKRMSWAAQRVTTKVEDKAYSLFGIFEVNMPLPYCEGTKAFTRLQDEILKDNDDQSLFAWQPCAASELSSPRLTPTLPAEDGISVFAPHP